MKDIFNAQKSKLIIAVAEELKKIEDIKPPSWAYFVKTGANKERPPVENDWWYKRTASVMLKLLNLGPVGVSKLRVKYGGKKRRGHKPAEFRKASGNILRKILQQLEKAGLAKQTKIGVHKGRILTPKAISLLSKTAKTAGSITHPAAANKGKLSSKQKKSTETAKESQNAKSSAKADSKKEEREEKEIKKGKKAQENAKRSSKENKKDNKKTEETKEVQKE